MKKQREPLRLAGTSIYKDGKSIDVDPMTIPSITLKTAAIVMTLETGVQHSVIA